MDFMQPALHRELRCFALSILKNEEDASEVVQDVLAHCHEKQPSGLNRAYIFKAVRNSSFNKLRSYSRYIRAKESLTHYLQLFLIPDHSEASIIDVVQELPLKQKEVLILRIKGELSHSEISEVLGIPVGTVKSRINKALLILKKKYKESHYE